MLKRMAQTRYRDDSKYNTTTRRTKLLQQIKILKETKSYGFSEGVCRIFEKRLDELYEQVGGYSDTQ